MLSLLLQSLLNFKGMQILNNNIKSIVMGDHLSEGGNTYITA